MINLRAALAFFKEQGGFNDDGMVIEWELFQKDCGDRQEYTKKEILAWLGY